ncbi:hypothetical protein CMO88_02680 [Candidatus Woesearchaeota archaeon]|nr:hypothetical protein [Candidatus Woesearchaeota archaeon]|tara:strand:+ start:3071 stop:3574 length:504 start_codon:yes stop_codon:yes gene_type:complete
MVEKFIDIVDEEDNVTGKATYEEIMDKGLIFRAANVFVFNSKGELFVHKRSRNLSTFPGMYDVKMGGIVDSGESYDEAAVRELKEESRIENIELEFLFTFKFRSSKYKNNRKVYKCVYDGDITLQEEEIEEGRFMTIEETKKLIEEGKVSESAVEVFKEYLRKRKTL